MSCFILFSEEKKCVIQYTGKSSEKIFFVLISHPVIILSG